MTAPATWRTDDPCPVCSTGLTVDTEAPRCYQDCRLCGWSHHLAGRPGPTAAAPVARVLAVMAGGSRGSEEPQEREAAERTHITRARGQR